ncbi:MAG: rhomboid family intramembrane serine protease [Chloroflexi bacterium]|nr:rhomboid family intramembrane serine protease [Chloroflexota bacterium]
MNDSTEPTSSYSQPPAPLPAPVIEDKLVSPIVTYVLVALTVAIYLLQMGTNALFHVDLPAALGMKVNQYIMAGQLWRLLTPMFLHGSILHIGFNMYALVVIGSGLERRFGNWRFLLLYVLGSFGGNVFSFMLSPNPSLGASTSIFGLLGAQMVFFYQNRKMFGAGARRALQNVITVAAINLFIGLSPGIDNWGHLGGLIAGLIFTWFGGPKLGLEGGYPSLKVIDERGAQDQLLGAALVLLLFGFLAAAKIFGLISA